MKQTSSAVINLIDAARAAPDAPIAFAECFTFITTTGTSYTWTSVDYDVIYNGFTFNAEGPLVSGLKYKGSVGLEVDKQQITIAARPTDIINGAPFLIALRDGAFDGAPAYRDRVFLTGPMGSVVGGVRLFQGRISTVDNVGRTQATLTVASDLVILDYDMPKNLFSPTCLHVLYDSGCGIVRGTFSLDGSCGAGSNSGTIMFSGARAGDAQGSLDKTVAPAGQFKGSQPDRSRFPQDVGNHAQVRFPLLIGKDLPYTGQVGTAGGIKLPRVFVPFTQQLEIIAAEHVPQKRAVVLDIGHKANGRGARLRSGAAHRPDNGKGSPIPANAAAD